jgi:hypothetical protein
VVPLAGHASGEKLLRAKCVSRVESGEPDTSAPAKKNGHPKFKQVPARDVVSPPFPATGPRAFSGDGATVHLAGAHAALTFLAFACRPAARCHDAPEPDATAFMFFFLAC